MRKPKRKYRPLILRLKLFLSIVGRKKGHDTPHTQTTFVAERKNQKQNKNGPKRLIEWRMLPLSRMEPTEHDQNWHEWFSTIQSGTWSFLVFLSTVMGASLPAKLFFFSFLFCVFTFILFYARFSQTFALSFSPKAQSQVLWNPPFFSFPLFMFPLSVSSTKESEKTKKKFLKDTKNLKSIPTPWFHSLKSDYPCITHTSLLFTTLRRHKLFVNETRKCVTVFCAWSWK